MEMDRALSVALVVVLLAIVCPLIDSTGNLTAKTGLDPKLNDNSSIEKASDLKLVSSSTENGGKVRQVGGDQLNKSKEGIDGAKSEHNASSRSGSKETDRLDEGKSDSSGALKQNMGGNNQKENLGGMQESKEVPKEKGNEGDKEDPLTHVKECDASNKCTDKENKLVACLRVPGNESPDLSLLIQNKGKGPLKVSISAPDFVQLEKKGVQLQEKEDQEVKVSIRDSRGDNSIVLKAGNSFCKLDIREITHNFGKELGNSRVSSGINLLSRTPAIAVVVFAALLILASAWMCIKCQKKQLSSSGSKYQRLGTELPMLGRKMELEVNNGWDNNWGDDWDDEEAPKTPTMPVTPNLSSKGLASRRLNKEGRKD